MFYTVYKITNNVNQKYYIGMHQTNDLNDGYMGSGKLIRQAIEKYGIDKFTKEILHVFDTEEDMRCKEKELVVICEESYNLCDGGKGGFGYLNRSGKSLRTGAVLSEETKEKISKKKTGTVLSEETKEKLSDNNWAKRDPVAHREHMRKISKIPKTDEHKEKIRQSIKDWHAKRNAGVV